MTTQTHGLHNPQPFAWPPGADRAGREAAHQQTCDWLLANGVNPEHLPADPHASLADGRLTFLRKVRGPHGGDLLTPDRSDILTETVTVPVVVPPPPIVAQWLAPTCPNCGR